VGRRDDGSPEAFLALVSGANRVDVARLAAVVSESTLRRASAREVSELTGFVIGGVPPIGHERPVKVVMDPDLGRFRTVWAAAGTPTSVFAVPPATLRTLANAVVAPIADERATGRTSDDATGASAASRS
jgi:prolyl-tRNA editing enzyme YbaK/EbsC (Cys-tRNA(Pro) deacylase)